jgi:hypothetical protein
MQRALFEALESSYAQLNGQSDQLLNLVFQFINGKDPAFLDNTKRILDIAKHAHQPIAPPPAPPAESKPKPSAAPVKDTVPDVSEEDRPVGNGGTTDKYVWTQTLAELTVTMQVPANIKSKDMIVEIKPQRLAVGIKGQDPLVNVCAFFPRVMRFG